ncbi:hypothetical protein [Halobacillus amylolyticus]|uniref:Lipoprotein n=1 Tax=Halobacillus amylolyticus TaxID=2932259 RepID=A0ABY4HGR1_9BACI|nr:hypothetical protein [Halobacillus amylolyticus]UOR14078.1 hypothetical protein MUO15_21215 [Halobacillus amylolyticus]
MKKIMVLLITAAVFLITGCSNAGEEKSEAKSESKPDKPIFTKEDISLAKEMIFFVNEKEKEFIAKVNERLKEKKGETSEEIRKKTKPLAQKIVIHPFLEKYGEHVTSNTEQIKVELHLKKAELFESKYNKVSPTFTNLKLENPEIINHEKSKIHELVFKINESETESVDLQYYNQYTFLKTNEGKLIINDFPPLSRESAIYLWDSDNVKNKIKKLPPLQ